MRDKKAKYQGVDIALESARINDIVVKLPRGHNWGTVNIEINIGCPIGGAVCTSCGLEAIYASNFSKEWIYPNTLTVITTGCEEYKMSEALE